MNSALKFLAAVVGIALLGACGQKGPLYLPDDAAPALVVPPPATSAAPGQSSDAQPPAGAAQDTKPEDVRSKSSR